MLDYIPPDYATIDQLREDAPPELLADTDARTLARLLRFASGLVRSHTKRAVYQTTEEGLPTSTGLRQIFREATTAQIISWLENDLTEDVLSGGVAAEVQVSSTSSNGKSLTLDTSTSDAARVHLTSGGLGAEAEMILDGVGLLGGMPGVSR